MTYDSMKRGLVAIGLVAAVAGVASAQQAGVQQVSAGPKWRGWTGCWAPIVPEARVTENAPSNMVVCISPTSSADVVDVTTVTDGKVSSQQKLDASGREQPLTAKGCTGMQRGAWSADERRLYLKAASTCEGLRTTTSAILSMTAAGEWLDVRGVSAYGDENVRIARYRDVGIPSTVPAEIASALRGSEVSSENARIAAGAPIGTSAVIEASRSADSAVVAAWLLERGQSLSFNASKLLELSKAGVPSSVTDAMVAVTYPRAFHLARADRANQRTEDVEGLAMRRRITAVVDRGYYDPYGWGYSSYGYAYGMNRYGYGYGSGYGGYGGGGGYYGGGYYAPIVIIRDPNASTPQTRGQVVNGRGYTQTPPPPSSTGQQSTGSSSGSSSSGSSGSSSPSSSGSSSSSSESGGRTAKPRP
ncbi:MAG: hypothetical protein ABIP93_02645 [Gemmatimonadaceae bacterium]